MIIMMLVHLWLFSKVHSIKIFTTILVEYMQQVTAYKLIEFIRSNFDDFCSENGCLSM